MKIIHWGLWLFNGLLAWMIAFPQQTLPANALQPQLHPDQMQLLQAEELAQLPPRPTTSLATGLPEAESAKPSESSASLHQVTNLDHFTTLATLGYACAEWGSFGAQASKQALAVTQQLQLKALISQQTAANPQTRYWIYHPPFDNQETAQQNADTFKRLGVDEVFIVQEPQFKYAISFGVFRDEQLADKLMASLKAKGIRSVVKSRRLGGEGQTMLQLNFINASQLQALKKTQPMFPDADLKPVDCPPIS